MLYADDNNGILCTSDKTPHPKGSNADWPRMIYEHMFGMFSLNPSDATDEMNNDSKYNTMMYCPVLLGERDPIKNKPGGRSAYSMNRYFGKAGNDFTLNNLSGKIEPYIMPGTPSDGANAAHSDTDLTGSRFQENNNGFPAYNYNGKTLALFIAGNVDDVICDDRTLPLGVVP